MPTTNYIWDEENLLAETDVNNVVQTVYTNEPQQYGNLISARISGTTSYHHFDAIGSTRQLTNSAGTVTDTMIHDAWGNVMTRTGTTVANLLWIGEVGYYFDSEIGQFYVRRRPYNPVIGRWMTVDAAGFIDGPNRFSYVHSNVITRVDPSGLLGDGTFELTMCDCSTIGVKDRRCCTAFNVRYLPGAKDKAAFSRIYLKQMAKTQIVKFHCLDLITDWHDDPATGPDEITDYSLTPGLGKSSFFAQRLDDPGSDSSGYFGCPGLCAYLSLVQSFEDCAIGVPASGAEKSLGCTSFSHRCKFSYINCFFACYDSCTVTRSSDCPPVSSTPNYSIVPLPPPLQLH